MIREAESDRTFNCLAQNEAGAALESVDLTVTKQLPEFSKFPDDMEMDEDQDLYLDCVVDEESEVIVFITVSAIYYRYSLAFRVNTYS